MADPGRPIPQPTLFTLVFVLLTQKHYAFTLGSGYTLPYNLPEMKNEHSFLRVREEAQFPKLLKTLAVFIKHNNNTAI